MIAARKKRKSKAGMGFRVAAIERDGAPRQRLFLTLCSFRPAEDGGKPEVSPRKHRIEIDGPLKELLGKDVILVAGLAEMPHSSLIGAPGIKTCLRLAHRPLLFGVSDGRRDGDGRGLSNFVLYGENVREITVVALGPDMIAGLGLNKLSGHANTVAGFSETTFEHVADAEFAPDLFHIDRTDLVGKGRVPGDHEKRGVAGQRRDDVLGNPIGEVLLLGSPLMFWNGSTTIEGLSGKASAGARSVGAALGVVSVGVAPVARTLQTRTGRAIFLRACSPISSNVRSSRPAASS